jgi:hypothetical protein
MLRLRTQFLLAASLLVGSSDLFAAKYFPTSPLIQIGDDIDIVFDSSIALDVKDNLYSAVDKVSATSLTIKPGFTLEYAKDSPLYATVTAQRSFVNYYGKSTLTRLNNYQDNFSGSLYIDQGGPLKVNLASSYNESARNDDLTSKGIDGTLLGETLVRQGSYSHSLKADYRLTEKLSASVGFKNSYNNYLNPTKILDVNTTTGDETTTFNTNSLSEQNAKTFNVDFTYVAPDELITYGFSFSHATTNFSAAPYYKKVIDGTTHLTTTDTTTRPVTPDPAALTIFKNVKQFYGLTASGKPTSSGKLRLNAKAGFSSSTTSDSTAGDSKLSGATFDLSLNHTLTDRMSHELTATRDTSPTPGGADSQTKTYGYMINYSATEMLTLNFHVTKSDVFTGGSTIGTMDYNLGAVYTYNSHFSVNASLDSLMTTTSASSFRANSLSIQASFRY